MGRARPIRGFLGLLVVGSLWLTWAIAAEPESQGVDSPLVLEGRVVKVFDGDTIDLLVGQRTHRVRLSGIDTPERGQPWADRSRQALSERVAGKEVRVIQVDVDRYGRTVGEVYADDVCVGCELVRGGHAWVYRRYTDDEVLYQLEAEAQQAKRGIWGLPESERVPPWEWRRRKKKSGGSGKASAPRDVVLECGVKRTCSQMVSCAEARFHLEECGLTHLDGDADGMPCNALCREER
jgi:endonuclease YncB( thermonuclease family)